MLECGVLMFYDHVELSFTDVDNPLEAFKDSKKGAVYLLPYQVVFVAKDNREALKSFTMPFYLMKGCEIKQPVLGANYIKGIIKAEPNGGWEGSAAFKLSFTSGGTIEFGQQMLHTASQASRGEIPAGAFGYTYMPNSACGTTVPVGVPAYDAPNSAIFAYPPPLPAGFYPGPPPTEGTMNYMAPPPYPGPMTLPGGDALLSRTQDCEVGPANKSENTLSSQSAPHSVPMDQPPPYTPCAENQGQQCDQLGNTVRQPLGDWSQQPQHACRFHTAPDSSQ
ncbi:WW domain-binding protein 2-like isoform X2 [Stegostoma tigrinum]|uniref:WW domain-binding protein 2-like isoform X2 n=1 Tax=Stegostoma tigrinum TaxID=3053191 RepID=UPI0028700BEE|nr:WW domain-binding protein 2-like isoform X2 [Stegostoma tigrinum]